MRGRKKPPQAGRRPQRRLLAVFTPPPGGLNLFGTVTVWTGRTCPLPRSFSGSPARCSPAPSCFSITPPSTLRRLCLPFWRLCSRRGTPLSPSPSSSSRAPAAPIIPSTIPAGSVLPEAHLCMPSRFTPAISCSAEDKSCTPLFSWSRNIKCGGHLYARRISVYRRISIEHNPHRLERGELKGAAARLEWNRMPRKPCAARLPGSGARTFTPLCGEK